MKRICAWLLCLSLVSPAVAGAPAAWPDWAREALGWGQEMSISGEFLNAPAARKTAAGDDVSYANTGLPWPSATASLCIRILYET